jgi:hypothetical protein
VWPQQVRLVSDLSAYVDRTTPSQPSVFVRARSGAWLSLPRFVDGPWSPCTIVERRSAVDTLRYIAAPDAVAIGDVDGDGLRDIVVTADREPMGGPDGLQPFRTGSIYLPQRGGTFVLAYEGTRPADEDNPLTVDAPDHCDSLPCDVLAIARARYRGRPVSC